METILIEEDIVTILRQRIKFLDSFKKDLSTSAVCFRSALEVRSQEFVAQSEQVTYLSRRKRSLDESAEKNCNFKKIYSINLQKESKKKQTSQETRVKKCHDSYVCPVAIFGTPDPNSIPMYPKSRVYVNNETDRQLEELRSEDYKSSTRWNRFKRKHEALQKKRKNMFLCAVKYPEAEVANQMYMFSTSSVYPGYGQDISFEELLESNGGKNKKAINNVCDNFTTNSI